MEAMALFLSWQPDDVQAEPLFGKDTALARFAAIGAKFEEAGQEVTFADLTPVIVCFMDFEPCPVVQSISLHESGRLTTSLPHLQFAMLRRQLRRVHVQRQRRRDSQPKSPSCIARHFPSV